MEDIKTIQQPELAQHDSSVLDLAFAMDCTGSMSSYIKNAQENIRKIVEEIVAGEKSDICLALVKYRDHPPEDRTFVTDVLDFTASIGNMKKKLDGCAAAGGGDEPEAVADALQQVLKLSWRENATKICVLISDAPPHGLKSSGDSFPNGCPDGLDPVRITREMAEKGITLYSVGCEPSICPYKEFFSALAHMTGGQYVPLGNASLLAKVIIGGAQEEVTLERLMSSVNQEVQEAAAASGGVVDEFAVAKRLHGVMLSKKIKSKQLKRNDAVLEPSSAFAMKLSEMDCLADIKTEHGSEFGHGSSSALGFDLCAASPGSSGPTRRSRMACSFAAPAMLATPAETYDVCEDEISECQVQRMVKKSVCRQKLAKK